MANQNGNIPLETRVILLERDMELVKLKESDTKILTDMVNRNNYKMESLERILDDTREKFDETKVFFRETISSQKELQETLIKKFEQVVDKIDEEKPKPAANWQGTAELIGKIIFVILILAAATMGINLPGGIQ